MLVIIAAVLLTYANSFSVPFLFDDDSSIKDNPSIRSLLTAWSPPAGGGHTVSGRPFLNFTLALSYALSGTAVWGYHLVNILIHAAAACVLFGLLRRTLAQPLLAGRFGRDATWLALAVAMLWALHPLQTESVTYIIQRAESLVGLMYLLTFWCFIRAAEPAAPGLWAWLAFAACLLGMASKEVMVTAPVMIALYDRIFLAGSWREVWRRRGRLHLALASTWLLLAWLVIGSAGRGGTAGLGTAMSPWSYALTQVGAVAHYLRLALWPSPLVFDYGTDLVGGWGDVWWQALLLFPLAAASLWASWRGWAVGFPGVFFFAVLAPSSSFVPVITQTMAEHRAYLALAAVVAVVGIGAHRLMGRKSLVVLALLGVACGVATVRRNGDYRTEQAIWEDVVLKRPGNVRAVTVLVGLYQKEGRDEEARAILLQAQAARPHSLEIRNNLGNAWMRAGNWAEAESCFRQALALDPAEPYTLNNLGNALLQLGRPAEAVAQFEAALHAKPDFPEPRYNLANTLAQAGRLQEAAAHYEVLLRLKPADAEARANYGDVLLELGRSAEGLVALAEAVRLQPDNAELHNNLGVALARLGRPAEALSHFRAALRLRPDFAEARQNLERATRAAGG